MTIGQSPRQKTRSIGCLKKQQITGVSLLQELLLADAIEFPHFFDVCRNLVLTLGLLDVTLDFFAPVLADLGILGFEFKSSI